MLPKRHEHITTLLVCVLTTCYTHAQSWRVANTLQSNMVVQQNKPLRVWGTAATGDVVQVQADWLSGVKKDTTDPAGEWMIELPVPAAVPGDYTTHTITVANGKQQQRLENILIGDVWLCSGQSNMDMQLKPFLPWLLGAMHYEQEIANALYPQIRLYDLQTNFAATPMKDGEGAWSVCSPLTVPDYSAVAYFFARDIFLQRRIPIGLVVSSIGASTAQAWTSRDTLAAVPLLQQKYLYPYDTSARSKEVLDATVTFDKVARPTLLYNAMIYPLRHLSLSGILWYQGESNRWDGPVFTRLLAAMVRNWRHLFNQGDLPFYYVQVAPYNWQENKPEAFEYAELREAQANLRQQVPATAMAVTMDIADPNDLHPRNKQDVGYRLARLALEHTYKVPGIISSGPEYQSVQVQKDTLVVSFVNESMGTGLATNDGQAPRHFFIAGADKKFYPAEAVIRDNQVWLHSKSVKKPIAVRYAFTNYPVTNFCNKEGFPAVPFRSSF
jgi:sialate O-acetylesterase